MRRGFKIAPGEIIRLVEEVVTKGARVQETIDIVPACQAQVAAVAMIGDRCKCAVDPSMPVFSLIQMNVETFAFDKLPSDSGKFRP